MNEDAVGTTPTSVGALLAEEWTIDPYSALPSFLEMMWIQEVDKSMHQALQVGLDQLKETIDQHEQAQIQTTRDQSTLFERPDASEVNFSTIARRLGRFMEICKRKCITMSKNVLQRYRNAIIALVVYAVERESLSRINATIAESMYGGHRVQAIQATNVQDNTNGQSQGGTNTTRSFQLEPLKDTAITRFALLKALSPYLKSKLDSLMAQYRQEQDREQQTNRRSIRWNDQQGQEQQHGRHRQGQEAQYRSSKIKRTMLFLYPYLRATLQGLNLLCHWRFLMGQSFHFDLISLLLGQVVRRITLQDQKGKSVAASKVPFSSSSSETNKRTVGTPSLDSTSSSSPSAPNEFVSTSLTTSDNGNSISLPQDRLTTFGLMRHSIVFGTAVAILLSWMAWTKVEWDRIFREERMRFSSPLCPVPPPPPSIRSTGTRTAIARYRRLMRKGNEECPLCHGRPRQSPTATKSGFVFCWDCIHRHVSRSQTCPITGQPCTEQQLLRLYEPRLTTDTSLAPE
ncbi:hypothetical protein ACA910_011265 [Epithemia clementina (nom. ined.)]